MTPTRSAPRFRKVLSDAFLADEELICDFQAIAGYWLTGRTDRQEFYIFHGMGSNGKSTILNAITHVLGPYAGELMCETIFKAWPASTVLILHRCETTIWPSFTRRSPNSNSMRLASNRSRARIYEVRPLYKDPITFRPKFKVVVVCNKRPNLDAYDPALKRRIKLIPFDHVVPPSQRDRQLEEKLKAEAPGILNFMIDGAKMYFRCDVREPNAVTAATQRYHADQDFVGSFLKDSTIADAASTVGKGPLYDAYASYCADECSNAVSKGDFGKIILSLNYMDTRGANERKWKGLRLRLPDEPSEMERRWLASDARLKRAG